MILRMASQKATTSGREPTASLAHNRSAVRPTLARLATVYSLRQQLALNLASIIRVDNQGGFSMSFIAWIVLGLISGFIASKIVNKSGEGLIVDILLGIVGAFLGGWLFNEFGMAGVTGVNLYSMLVAVIGAVIFLVIYHALFRRRV
jgi:uncharacterized membrane protein YeaQ/YmgE (transglycosylase-associated protein family)